MAPSEATPPESDPETSAFGAVRRIYLERDTGVLALGSEADGADRLFFVSGDLYLRPEHPLAVGAAPDEEEGEGRKTVAVAAIVDLVKRVAAGDFEFSEGIAHISSDLVGPLPTASVLMEGAVRNLDEFQLLKQLGGEERRFVATTGEESLQTLPDLDPQEAFLLSRLDQPTPVKELLRQADMERERTLEKLCRLQAIDLIRPQDKAVEAEAQGVLTAELVQRFSDRIRDGLERSPLELDPRYHRERIGALMGQLGEMTFYELLQVEVSAPAEQIHDAYTKLARLVHPGHAESLGLRGKEAGMHLLFERATEAYLTLSDSERSRKYLAEMGPLVKSTAGKPSEAVRDKEEKKLADHNFRLAKSMALREEYHFAIELLNQAVRADPKPEYYVLLAECQEQNPQWARKAIFNYSQALELAPGEPDIVTARAKLYAQIGNTLRAREEFDKVLQTVPGHPEAVRGLARLKHLASRRGEEGPFRRALGWVGRLVGKARSG